MSHWQAQSQSPMTGQQQPYLPHNHSQETLDPEDIASSSELPPQSPVFDFEDFLTESASTHQMASSSHLSMMVPTDLDGGNPHLWATWDSPPQCHQEHPLNQFQSNISPVYHSIVALGPQGSPSISLYCPTPLNQPRRFKSQDAVNAGPQAVFHSAHVPQQQQMGPFTLTQPTPYQPSSSSFSDCELALSSTGIAHGNGGDMFNAGKLDDQQLSHHYHGLGKTPYGDSGHGNSQHDQYPAYRQDSMSVHSLLHSTRADHRRQYIPRRDSSVPPCATDYHPLRSNANVNCVFAASAPTPSVMSCLGSVSPSSSPRSIDGHSVARSSPSLPPASPQTYTPSSPGMQFSAPPSQFSASPHQITSVSPIFTPASPITFVDHTTQYTSIARSDNAHLSSAQEYIDPEHSRLRKRRRVLLTDAEDDSDEKRSEDTPLKSELRPPKQAPSMWQIYFADWLQDHKARQPQDKLNVAQAAKEAGQLYKTLNAEQKEDLKRRVQLEKESRERRLAAWQRTLTPGDIKRENKFRAAQRKAGLSRRANIKDPNAPKKPLSAYFMFLARIRSDPVLVQEVFGGETETTRQSVLAAQRWREMSDEEKKPFLTQAEHDKIQYEALRKIYEEQASPHERGSRPPAHKQMTGTGYIVPQQIGTSDDLTAAILSARPSTSEPDTIRMVAYDPDATITARKSHNRATPMPIFSPTGTIRRRVVRKTARLPGGGEGFARSYTRAGDSGMESSESDDEWVPGKSI